MAKFQAKQKIVEVEVYFGPHPPLPLYVVLLTHFEGPWGRRLPVSENGYLFSPMAEGLVKLNPGDFIVYEENGNCYRLCPPLFRERFEPVQEETHEG